MFSRGILLLAICLFLVAGTAQSGDKKEQENFKGTWSVIEVKGGMAPAQNLKGAKMTFEGDKLTFQQDEKKREATFSVHPTQKPKGFDLHLEQNGKKLTLQGIYELEGDNLKICHFAKNKQSVEGRPKALTADDQTVVIVLKRDK
jgi:uncharacterized protein (TIGR03067 family)